MSDDIPVVQMFEIRSRKLDVLKQNASLYHASNCYACQISHSSNLEEREAAEESPPLAPSQKDAGTVSHWHDRINQQ